MAGESTVQSKALDRLKTVVEWLGVGGGTGAGFAALAFGVGYLATSHHDAMLGVPTTVTATTAYVRTGAVFFTQSLHDLVAALAALATFPFWSAVVGGAAIVGVLQWLSVAKLRGAWRWLPLLVGTTLLLVTTVRYIPRHLAPLDAGNKNLLFESRPVAGHAKAVNDLLRAKDSEPALHLRYGTQWVILLGLGLGALILHRWRLALQSTTAAAEGGGSEVERLMGRVHDWALRPAVYTVLVAQLVAMPASYGVLAMSISLPCVQLHTAPTDKLPQRLMGEPGYLWADLAADTAHVRILRWDTSRSTYFLDLHPRAGLNRIEVRPCGTRNPLHRVVGT